LACHGVGYTCINQERHGDIIDFHHATKVAFGIVFEDGTLALMMTVIISIFSHGLSALPGISYYAGRIARLDSAAPERQGGDAEKSAG
jgi:hypothetical protein